MKRIYIIGIGAGDPDYLTIQAVKAMNVTDVFFIMDKGSEKSKLTDFRREICQRHITGTDYRFVEADSPAWNRNEGEYGSTIGKLNRDKQAIFEWMVFEELADGETGAFLVWGDPSLYDSTIRIIDAMAQGSEHQIELEIIPGISSVQALAAKHHTTLNSIGRPVEITTGRRLAGGFPTGTDSVVVMLDAEDSYRQFADQDINIYWGAYLGTPDEILIAGKLGDVAEKIRDVRSEARKANGWIMDTYLLRRNDRQE